jgi:hypothetical protein
MTARRHPETYENKKPQIILALSSWLLALSKQQARRIMLAGFSRFSFPASYLPSFPASQLPIFPLFFVANFLAIFIREGNTCSFIFLPGE